MDLTIFICLVFILQGFYWFIGRRSSLSIKNQEDYFLAGKNVRFFPLMMTFLATQVGGGVILGSADEAYLFGSTVLLYPLGVSLGLILLGCGVGRKLANFQVSTVAQIFECAYGSSLLKKFASFLSIISLFMILVAQIMASGKFLISLGIDNNLLFIIFWASVIIYTAKGGLKAVIATDLVQASLFSFIFIGCFAYLFYKDSSLSLSLISKLPQLEPVSSKLCGWLLLPTLFMIIGQDMGQRCFAGSNARTVSKSALSAGILTFIVCLVPVFIGSIAKLKGLEIPQGGSVLMTAVIGLTNPWLSMFVGCAILAAIISTATSLIGAISSNLANDFDLSIFKEIRFVQIVTALLSILAICFAFYFESIVDLIIQTYELSISCLFVPLIFALYKEKAHFLSALLAISFGVLGFMLFRIYPIVFPKELANILLSLLGYALGNLIVYYRSRAVLLT